ncbi:MAG: class I SAM-dependent methyltransferase [Gammaproteobacteria bacterium]|jgi:trans-aconitate methyltransferase
MQRIPEPELMDDQEQAAAYANADFEEPHEQFVDLFQQAFPNHEFTGVLLDLGCGPGDITRRVARRFPSVRIDAVDGAVAMLDEGRRLTTEPNEASRIQYIHGLLPGCSLPQQHYDGIFSNSLLHHLADPMVLWRSIKAHAKPGTPVFVMDLLRPDNKETAKGFVEQYAAGEPAVLQEDFYNSLLAAFEIDEVRQQLTECGLLHLQISQVSDRHLTVSGYF